MNEKSLSFRSFQTHMCRMSEYLLLLLLFLWLKLSEKKIEKMNLLHVYCCHRQFMCVCVCKCSQFCIELEYFYSILCLFELCLTFFTKAKEKSIRRHEKGVSFCFIKGRHQRMHFVCTSHFSNKNNNVIENVMIG